MPLRPKDPKITHLSLNYRSHLHTSHHRDEYQRFHFKLHLQLMTPPVNRRVSIHDLMIPTNSLYYVRTWDIRVFIAHYTSRSGVSTILSWRLVDFYTYYLGASLDRLITDLTLQHVMLWTLLHKKTHCHMTAGCKGSGSQGAT